MKNKVQYIHNRTIKWDTDDVHDTVEPCGGSTGAVEVPTLKEIEQFEIGSSIILNYGFARCHSEENFNKKIGRQVAEGRMLPKNILVKSKIITDTGIYLILKNEEAEIHIERLFSKDVGRLIYFN